MAVVQWAGLAQRQWPVLELLFAVPNGARTSLSVARRLKAEGMKSGVPDLCLPVPRCGYVGLWIEMKARQGRVQPTQKRWADQLTELGHLVAVCRDATEAIELLRAYLAGAYKGATPT